MNRAQKSFSSLRQSAWRLTVLPLAVFATNALAGDTLPPNAVDEPASFGLIGGLVVAGLAARWVVRRRGRKGTGSN